MSLQRKKYYTVRITFDKGNNLGSQKWYSKKEGEAFVTTLTFIHGTIYFLVSHGFHISQMHCIVVKEEIKNVADGY